jgi:hypothetical protein
MNDTGDPIREGPTKRFRDGPSRLEICTSVEISGKLLVNS